MTFTTTEEFYGIGIDESNHHTVPEVYALTLSTGPAELEYIARHLPRDKHKKKIQRAGHIKIIEELLAEVKDMRFIVLYRKHISRLGRIGIKAPAMHRLISSLDSTVDIEMARIIIDGEHIPATHSDLREMLQESFDVPIDPTHISFLEKADKHVPLVNKADIFAYNLMRIYENIPLNRRGPFNNHRVYLGIHLPEKNTQQSYTHRPKRLIRNGK